MVNGRINRAAPARELAADRDLQQRLLGVGRHAHDDTPAAATAPAATAGIEAEARAPGGPTRIYISNPSLPTRWSKPVAVATIERNARLLTVQPATAQGVQRDIRPLAVPGAAVVLVVGTLDTKGVELRFMRDILRDAGVPVRLVDLSTSGAQTGADVPAHQVAAFHPRGAAGVLTGDRGTAVAGMTEAFARWLARQEGIAGIVSAAGSGGTAMVAPAMRALPIGIPKLIVSTLATLGAGFDCASKGEMAMVLKLGVKPEDIIFAHPAKQPSHIQYAATKGVKKMTFDNEDELRKIAREYPGAGECGAQGAARADDQSGVGRMCLATPHARPS
jgi:hypothetical protein